MSNEDHEHDQHDSNERHDEIARQPNPTRDTALALAAEVAQAAEGAHKRLGFALEGYERIQADPNPGPRAVFRFLDDVRDAQQRFQEEVVEAGVRLARNALGQLGIDPSALKLLLEQHPELHGAGLSLDQETGDVKFVGIGEDGEEFVLDAPEAPAPDPDTSPVGEATIPGIDFDLVFEPERDVQQSSDEGA